MARRKQNETLPVNLRLDAQLRHQLETAAKAHGITFSAEIRLRLTKANQSLNSYLADWERAVCDTIERDAHGSTDIEATWRRLAELRTKLAHLQTGVEEVLLPNLANPKVRELVRGIPASPNKTKRKPSQKGGKS
jgi:hypothetical protein